MVDESNRLSILFFDFFDKIGLLQDIITSYTKAISNPVGCIPLDVIVMIKSLTVDILLKECKPPLVKFWEKIGRSRWKT